MICQKCGSHAPDGSRFCLQCGAPLQTPDTSSPSWQPDQIPKPLKLLHTFEGWYLEGSDTPYDFSQPVTVDLTLHARWKAVTPPSPEPPGIAARPHQLFPQPAPARNGWSAPLWLQESCPS